MKPNSKQWNQGNVEQSPFAMQRRQATHRVVIDAPAGWVFERACLAGQPGWLPAGSLRLSYAESGQDEKNALWSESETGPAVFQRPGLETVWTTTRLDPEGHRYQSVLINPELAMGTLDVEMEERDDGTLVRFDLSYTALSEEGSALFDAGFDGRLGEVLEGFGRRLTSSLTAEPAAKVTPASYRARRRRVEHEVTINGDVDECFALACPVAELLWIDDWKFNLIYSSSGKNEDGCVFLEPFTGMSILRSPGANTYWYVNRYDTERHLFDAVWVTRDLTVVNWGVSMTDLGGGQTRVTWSLIYTGLSEQGSRIIGELGMAGRMKGALGFLATAMKHYVETGDIFRVPSRRKLQVAASLIGAALGRHFHRQRVDYGGASTLSK
jgi:hypothetical protein